MKRERPGSLRHHLPALVLLALSLGPLSAPAIPVQIQEHNLSLTLPEGFEEMAPLTNDPDVVRLFVRRASPADEPNTWLAIRRVPAAGVTNADWAPAPAGRPLLGRYGEQVPTLDVDALQATVLTNEAMLRERQARLSAGDVPLQLDIRSRALADREMKELMRTILASAAVQAEEPQEPSSHGWGAMFLCLALGGALIVIACGRR
jgi:hypothetical protein